jgi:N6-adenosine-specific RNA methylase IME4
VSDLITQVRALRAQGFGKRRMGAEIIGADGRPIGPDAAQRLIKKLELEDARASGAEAVAEIGPRTAAEYAVRITACWRKSVEAIFEAGRLLTAAKGRLEHGEFIAMVRGSLPFQEDTAQRLMKIAADPRLTNTAHGRLLPACWRTMYELAKLKDDTFAARIADGTIHSDMKRGDLVAAVHRERRAAHEQRALAGGTVENLHSLAAGGFKASAILADPPWKFMTRSERGEGRCANSHYRTEALDRIKALPVADLVASDAVLFLWAVGWLVEGALELIEAWGFRLKTVGFCWVKQNKGGEGWHMGQGYWTRANPELCLLATRGNPKRLHADVRQLIVAPVAEHSRKPDEVHERIERLVEGPFLELFARRERPGWITWGDELPFRVPLPPHDPETGEIIDVVAEAAE